MFAPFFKPLYESTSSQFHPKDPSKINVNEEEKLEYWSKELSVSKDSLKSASKNVRTSAASVGVI